jgi:hypothetical protein
MSADVEQGAIGGMTIPGEPKEQMDAALAEAWEAAERCKALLENNNGSSAVVWAQASQAWAAIAIAIGARLP